MKSGMIAAEEVFDEINSGKENFEIKGFQKKFFNSWAGRELKSARNVRPSFKYGLKLGLILSGLDQILLRGKAPWTLKHSESDHKSIKHKKLYKPIAYPKPDGEFSFDLLTNISFSGTNHKENQPSHLKLRDDDIPINHNHAKYDSPETRYCPAGVYELIKDSVTNKLRMQINFQNCLHCKTCDIKDPNQNITWTPPEGGGGPNYQNM